MIKYECDMCHKIFDGEDIDEYNMPRRWLSDVSNNLFKTIPMETHLCKTCAREIADMMKIVVDK